MGESIRYSSQDSRNGLHDISSSVRRIAWCALVVMLWTNCSDEPAQRAPQSNSIQLPSRVLPRFVAFDNDGSLWITESSADAIARKTPNGKVTHFKLEVSESSVGDIVKGPDGEMWFTGFLLIGRINHEGRITGWANFGPSKRTDLGLPEAITHGPDGAIWYTDESVPPSINRLSPSGSITSIDIESGEAGLYLPGITAGPDGALWFTQQPVSGGPEAIGRVTTNGRYTSWRLPRSHSGPTRITAGPDGALWFTEQVSYRIGRITTSGEITEFPLRPGLSPFDITTGKDGALWFTAETRIGRITTSGDVTTWPVPKARNLIGLAVDADGSLWIADGEGDAVHHFVPPK
jgi:virginiamycin B lyase